MLSKLLPLLLIAMNLLSAQDYSVQVVTEEIPNRLAFYAHNENEKDLDVLLTISGTNFRQSAARPRYVRVPAASRVHLKTIVLLRGKQPDFSYKVVVNDSLSSRSLRKESQPIKINPTKSITIYLPEECPRCDSLIVSLTGGKYKFSSHVLGERPEIRDQLSRSFGNRINLDTLQTPIVNLGGTLFTTIENYGQLLDILAKD
jgi:hypothetical protein